jgi:hypothetical protein
VRAQIWQVGQAELRDRGGGGQAVAGPFTALAAFVGAITKSILPSPSLEDGLKAPNCWADKATESLKSGQPVKFAK